MREIPKVPNSHRASVAQLFIALMLSISLVTAPHLSAEDLTANLPERQSSVKAAGRALILQGTPAIVGQPAPDAKVADANFKAVKLSDYHGKYIILSVVPSLDTGTCTLQTKAFHDRVTALPPNVVLLTISTDLPFAQKRFCQQHQIDKMPVLSDAVWGDFGSSYGVRIKDMGLLTRSVFLINPKGILVYQQLVPVLSEQPNYDAVLQALQQAMHVSSITE